jgi:hypothetical protein
MGSEIRSLCPCALRLEDLLGVDAFQPQHWIEMSGLLYVTSALPPGEDHQTLIR